MIGVQLLYALHFASYEEPIIRDDTGNHGLCTQRRNHNPHYD